MSIIWIQNGDIFESRCQTVAIPVNMVPSVMGAGLALAAKKRWPMVVGYHGFAARQGMFDAWQSVLWCHNKSGPQVLLVPTKRHWKDKSHIETVSMALEFLSYALKHDAKLVGGVAFPALGCGRGGLDWADVRPLMERYLGGLDIPVEVYEPRGAA